MKKLGVSIAFLAGVFFSACGNDSSNSATNEEAEAYCEDAGNKGGYVQFNQDVYSSPVGAGVYVYDCKKSSKTVDVTLTSLAAAGSLKLTLDRYDLYYYAPFSMGFTGAQGEVLLVSGEGDVITVNYNGSGDVQYDYAEVSLFVSSDSISMSFGKTPGFYNTSYVGYVDKAVIHLTDRTIQNADPVYVYVNSSIQKGSYECSQTMPSMLGPDGSVQQTCMFYGSDYIVSSENVLGEKTRVALYPVSEGDNSERIGFVEFVSGVAKDGQVHVEPAGEGQRLAVTATYTNNFGVTKTAVTSWVAE